MSYAWPGNIRELLNFIERAVILTKGDVLQLPPLRSTRLPARTEPLTLRDAERDHILRVLEETNWVISGKHGAAARPGMARTTLTSKMQRRGISRRMAPKSICNDSKRDWPLISDSLATPHAMTEGRP